MNFTLSDFLKDAKVRFFAPTPIFFKAIQLFVAALLILMWMFFLVYKLAGWVVLFPFLPAFTVGLLVILLCQFPISSGSEEIKRLKVSEKVYIYEDGSEIK